MSIQAKIQAKRGEEPSRAATSDPLPVSTLLPLLLHVIMTAALLACGSPERPAGTIAGERRAQSVVEAETTRRENAAESIGAASRGAAPAKQILFGDLHVHTTYSIDAFMYSLPIFAGEGAHPPADACDFARHCAGLDFFSINDHAEGLTRDLWERTKVSIRQCNEVAGDPENPDLVAFTGWEWTQTGTTPGQHFGHKNVVFPGLGEDELPRRPISAVPVGATRVPPSWVINAGASVISAIGYPEYAEVVSFMGTMAGIPDCAQGIDSRDLPLDCRESATTPEALFRKLDEWGFPSLVIPHGLAWGIHSPPGAVLSAQLSRAQHDPSKQRLIEISSGHGNGEEFRDLPENALGDDGERICPAPTPDFLPCCWRAGEIARARCDDTSSEVCEEQVRLARQRTLDAGVRPHQGIPDASPEDWLDCDQCRDCFKPALHLRPGMTAQYGAALSNFEEGQDASRRRFRWGFISSTDNHSARPATGYKQYERRIMTDARGFQSRESEQGVARWTARDPEEPIVPASAEDQEKAQLGRLAQLFDSDREASFLYPGGIVAAHATGRDRGAIWDALMRREVYGTSGPRMLLWFDYVDPGSMSSRSPMGSEVVTADVPHFVVRAVGAHVQKPGCPKDSVQALGEERLARLCHGECYFPGDERHPITAIEVIRIRPQMRAGETIAPLIEDPWRRYECPPDPSGCMIGFNDPEYVSSGRDSVYYVRALQEPTLAINGANLRTEFDEAGNAIATTPCYGGYQTPEDDDCLAPVQERAWSSPIYVDHPERRTAAVGSGS